jgi:hypothetical protein
MRGISSCSTGYNFGRIVGDRNVNTSRVYFGVGAKF